MLEALPYVCMVRCGRPAVFVWLCKLHTIKDYVLCHATVISSTHIIKAEEFRRRHAVLFWKVCSMYEQSPVCLDNDAVTHNTSRRTAAAGRFIAFLVHLLTTVVWYSTWSIVSDLHNHANAARRPQRAMQTVVSQ